RRIEPRYPRRLGRDGVAARIALRLGRHAPRALVAVEHHTAGGVIGRQLGFQLERSDLLEVQALDDRGGGEHVVDDGAILGRSIAGKAGANERWASLIELALDELAALRLLFVETRIRAARLPVRDHLLVGLGERQR